MKRIVICSDGTWNRPGISDKGKPVKSNVEIIFNCISPKDNAGVKQVKFYETGVGSSSYDNIDKIFGGIEGFRLDAKLKDIYSFILLNYEQGDELYLFGFSRGAYTARSVAGFIRNCGILKSENIHLVDMAYDLYRNRNDYTIPDSDFMKAFREKYCVDNITPIKFIGVWDTVGSLGLPFKIAKKHSAEKYKFHDVKLSSYIQNAYHAMAIDEHRVLFEPTLWEISQNGIDKNQKVEQRWFAGVHCNIGGGYEDTGLSDLALEWLIKKAKNIGLEITSPEENNNKYYTFKPNYKGILRNSLTFIYWFWFPKRRELSLNNRIKITEDGSKKEVITNETIDESAFMRFKEDDLRYKPSNLKPFVK